MNNIELITTSDGSHSIYLKDLDEHYHSIHGAVQESKHVFIEAGLKPLIENNTSINILEIGLGTGLNCFLTFIEKNGCAINYTAIEAYPLNMDVINNLNYLTALNAEHLKNAFFDIHNSEWQKEVAIAQDFILHKLNKTLQDVELHQKYDLVYFDAFGPRVQPEMWTKEIFEKLYSVMNDKAILVTYCAKGEVKRNFKSVGFKLQTLQGPPGKREMVRCIK